MIEKIEEKIKKLTEIKKNKQIKKDEKIEEKIKKLTEMLKLSQIKNQ